jgi:sec-independent protein translocase protein TatA
MLIPSKGLTLPGADERRRATFRGEPPSAGISKGRCMGLSFWHMVILLLVVVLLFGRGKISDVMGDVAKGIKSFKKGLSEDEDTPPPSTQRPLELEAAQKAKDPHLAANERKAV